MIARVATWFEDEDPGTIRRWAIAGAIVVVLHVLVLCPYVYFYHAEAAGDDSTPISLDLSPSNDTVDQAEVLPPPDPPPPQLEQPPPEPQPPPPPPPQAIAEAPPPPPPPKVEEQPPPPPPTPARTKGGAPRVPPTWITAVTRRLEHFKRAPAKSLTGVVQLGFTVDRTGHVLSHEIVKSSGHPELDAEASSIIQRAQPLPPFPNDMTQDEIYLTVPVAFDLEH